MRQERLTLKTDGDNMTSVVISLTNQKGGVGKTSTTYHLAGTLALKMERRVLLLDMDPQASLTQAFIGPDAMRALSAGESIAALFGGDHDPSPARLIRSTGFEGIDLVPGSIHLTRFNVPEPERADPDDQRALADFIAQVRDDFDFILIDVPPNLHLCSWAALVASDYVVLPLQAEDFGSQGISAVLDSIDMVQERANPHLQLLGYLISMFNSRLAVHKTYEESLRTLYGAGVFETVIPLAADMKEAVALRLPIASHKPRGASAKAMTALAEEIINRVASIMEPESTENTDDGASIMEPDSIMERDSSEVVEIDNDSIMEPIALSVPASDVASIMESKNKREVA